jgi:hypothetical protein
MVLLDRNRLDNLPTERFAAGFHVAQIDVGQAIGKQSQQPVPNGMPGIENAVWSAA